MRPTQPISTRNTLASFLKKPAVLLTEGIVILVCVSCGLIVHALPSSSTTSAANAGASRTPTATKAPLATATHAPSGNSFVGGPYSSFTAKYGQPSGANKNIFYADSQQSVMFTVNTKNNTVTSLSILQVPDSWTDAQTVAECALFLPSGATKFNQSGQLTDYHSNIGEVVIQDSGQGTCTIYTA